MKATLNAGSANNEKPWKEKTDDHVISERKINEDEEGKEKETNEQ